MANIKIDLECGHEFRDLHRTAGRCRECGSPVDQRWLALVDMMIELTSPLRGDVALLVGGMVGRSNTGLPWYGSTDYLWEAISVCLVADKRTETRLRRSCTTHVRVEQWGVRRLQGQDRDGNTLETWYVVNVSEFFTNADVKGLKEGIEFFL